MLLNDVRVNAQRGGGGGGEGGGVAVEATIPGSASNTEEIDAELSSFWNVLHCRPDHGAYSFHPTREIRARTIRVPALGHSPVAVDSERIVFQSKPLHQQLTRRSAQAKSPELSR